MLEKEGFLEKAKSRVVKLKEAYSVKQYEKPVDKQHEKVDSIDIVSDFDQISVELKEIEKGDGGRPSYIDSNGDRILMFSEGMSIAIIKQNKSGTQDSIYSLSYDAKSGFALSFGARGPQELKGNHTEFPEFTDNLKVTIEEVRTDILPKFKMRMDEYLSFREQKRNDSYIRSQQYASLIEKRDKEDADRLLDDSYLV